MMTPESLQIASAEDSLASLGIVTNGVIVNIVFLVRVADCRRVPVAHSGLHVLVSLRWTPPVVVRLSCHLPGGMRPATPVFTPSLSSCLGST